MDSSSELFQVILDPLFKTVLLIYMLMMRLLLGAMPHLVYEVKVHITFYPISRLNFRRCYMAAIGSCELQQLHVSCLLALGMGESTSWTM